MSVFDRAAENPWSVCGCAEWETCDICIGDQEDEYSEVITYEEGGEDEPD